MEGCVEYVEAEGCVEVEMECVEVECVEVEGV